MTGSTFRKESRSAPPRYFEWEAAGLRWLADAPGGAAVVPVRQVGPTHLELARLVPAAPSAAAAYALGAALARTHLAGAPGFGAPPPGWTGPGFLGPTSGPLPLSLQVHPTWGSFYGHERLEPLMAQGRDDGVFQADHVRLLARLVARLDDGEHDTGEPPHRLHGDLWSGNVLWTADGAVLIDPAAHGGHRESDLAMLALFGVPHHAQILAGYAEHAPPAAGWRDRVLLHQIHPLLVHAVLFGGGYAGEAMAAIRHYR